MSALSEAKAHVGKAQEFFEIAQVSMDLNLSNAAASNAVLSGINSKDAICLKLTGRTAKTENHSDAVKELKQAGAAASGLASTLSRLLQLKSKAQYRSASVTSAEAQKAVEWAKRLSEGAQRIVTS